MKIRVLLLFAFSVLSQGAFSLDVTFSISKISVLRSVGPFKRSFSLEPRTYYSAPGKTKWLVLADTDDKLTVLAEETPDFNLLLNPNTKIHSFISATLDDNRNNDFVIEHTKGEPVRYMRLNKIVADVEALKFSEVSGTWKLVRETRDFNFLIEK